MHNVTPKGHFAKKNRKKWVLQFYGKKANFAVEK